MIKRYRNKKIVEIWSDNNTLKLWQKTELAVLEAKAKLGIITINVFTEIHNILTKTKIDIPWWERRDEEIHHDLNAFIDERIQHLPPDLQAEFHEKITSFDTEESAFVRKLINSANLVLQDCVILTETLKKMATTYRYTIMCSQTHGQQAELQTFGKRCLCWHQDLIKCQDNLLQAVKNLIYSKLSGASGNYGSIDPNVEKESLNLLGFKPYYGATQILPRLLFAHLAEALCQTVLCLDKIALDIRLGARSGLPIYHEPFKKKQKGSSAMPHKKNTIRTEQIEGMARMAKGYLIMIMDNVKTWEERAIEQSCVERVAWPDLFHVAIRSLKVINQVLNGLTVYPDNMLLEVVNTRGCYASSEAKEIIRKLGVKHGLKGDEGYRIIQLAAFNAFEPDEAQKKLRQNPPISLSEANELLANYSTEECVAHTSIQHIIQFGLLKYTDELDISQGDVSRWNKILKKIFSVAENTARWNQIFRPIYLLRNEEKLYQEILGE